MPVINKLPALTVKPEQTKTVAAGTSNKTVSPDSGYVLSSVTVQPTPSETKTATPSTSSQNITPTSGKLLSKVTVNAISTQTKSGTPSGAAQTINADSGKYMTAFTINAINKTFSALGTKVECSSGTTGSVTIPSGFHYGILFCVSSSNAGNYAMNTTFNRTGGVTAVTTLQGHVDVGRMEARYCQVMICSVTGNGNAGTVTHTGTNVNNEYMWLYQIY